MQQTMSGLQQAEGEKGGWSSSYRVRGALLLQKQHVAMSRHCCFQNKRARVSKVHDPMLSLWLSRPRGFWAKRPMRGPRGADPPAGPWGDRRDRLHT